MTFADASVPAAFLVIAILAVVAQALLAGRGLLERGTELVGWLLERQQ
jgi:hypothetical protein